MIQSSFFAFGMHQPATIELIHLTEQDHALKNMLIKSINKAKQINPDKKTNPAQSLEEYYAFLDHAVQALPWEILPLPHINLSNQIGQGLSYLNFINDQPLSELKGKNLFHNSLQYYEPYKTWLIHFDEYWGAFLNTDASWNDNYLKKVQAAPEFGLQYGWYENSTHWKTFNDFFSRHLKSPSARPIARPNDASILISPADSVPQGIWSIDAQSHIISGVQIKTKFYATIQQLLGPDSKYKDAFAEGTVTHAFLNTQDYHRYHLPLSGTVLEAKIIQGGHNIGGKISWNPSKKTYDYVFKDLGWQSLETRGKVILQTKDYGLVALLPIGIAQVSSVNFEHNIHAGAHVNKGDMLGYFLFGGSDFVMIFQKQVKLDLLVPKNKDGQYIHILMGEKYARLKVCVR
ncbi:MAG: phosphatidylserine decarboxylase [Legionellaceae bacterium]|nr:phosphatidylserine decarboxylase [Legionellaceae bacterium]